MSDRMTNVEIEDVLSSVRRLVSEDASGAARPGDRTARLVLTPAFRVPAEEVTAHESAGAGAGDEAGEEEPSLEARIAELEAVLAVQAADFEPDYERGEVSDFAPLPEAGPEPEPESAGAPESRDPRPGPARPWVDDVAEDSAGPAPARDMPAAAPPEGAAAGAGIFDDAEDLIDEETLRALVRDILREELQGALGERITRNVRKLVRAEVNRALAAGQAAD